jgi:hypothetical protein
MIFGPPEAFRKQNDAVSPFSWAPSAENASGTQLKIRGRHLRTCRKSLCYQGFTRLVRSLEAIMIRLRLAAVVAVAGFGVARVEGADPTSLETMNKALAEAKSTGKPLVVVGGAPER